MAFVSVPGVTNNELIRTTWGNTVKDDINVELIRRDGAVAMTGPLLLASPQSANAAAAVRRDYVDSTGNTKVDVAGDIMTGGLQVGGDPTGSVAGSAVTTTGALAAHRGAAAPGVNLLLFKSGAAFGTGQHYAAFYGQTTATILGTITQASSSSVSYVTSSDPRIKTRTGDADDSADIVHELGAKVYRGRYNADQAGKEWVFVNSTDVEDVAPYATLGDRDAVDDDGNVVPQQLDKAALVPLLLSALSQTLDRVADLTARVAALEGGAS